MVLFLIVINPSVCSFFQNHKKVKYLGVYLTNALTDDDDINRQVRSLYCSADQLKFAFHAVRLMLKTYCLNRIVQIFMVHIFGVIT